MERIIRSQVREVTLVVPVSTFSLLRMRALDYDNDMSDMTNCFSLVLSELPSFSTIHLFTVTERLLSQGLRVRGTARDVSQLRPMQEKIESTFGKDRFEVLEVKDFSASNAYEGAVKGESRLF